MKKVNWSELLHKMYATVILNTRQAGIGNGLTYDAVSCIRTLGFGVGSLVKAPLRKQLVEGIVIDVNEKKPEGNYDVKEIAQVLGDEPLLTRDQIETSKWMAEYYMCTLRQALGAWLPGGEWKKLLPEEVEMIRQVSSRAESRDDTRRIGKIQERLLEYLEGKDWMPWEKVREETGLSKDVVKRLVERELVQMKIETCCRGVWPLRPGSGQANAPTAHTRDTIISDVSLTPTQSAAHKAIKLDPRPTLLFGITGSGKTEVYAALIRDAIQEGKSAILLLPEILLTENFIGRFQQLVDREAIAIIHSRLTDSQRRRAWRGCKDGSIRLVIGSRSALFSPLPDLGLIILDEEHEWTYKNEQAPRYHAGKVAEGMRTKLIFGSATPSIESWHKAKTGKYQIVELPERYGGAKLPSVQVIDLAQIKFDRFYPFSPTLINAIRTRLDRNEQTILFLNRRGFATSLLCMECRYRFEDPETHLPYTVHFRGSNPHLLSHHTGKTHEVPECCPKCSSKKLRPVGAGTQRVEKILEELFPEGRILRADADTLKTPEKIRVLLEKMKTGKADILLGTQSVVKGLDLPNVTLAAVLLADVGLSLPHFRAGERVFQLLTQLTGRSGRRDPGEVIIQTFRPRAVEVELASQHDVKNYLERELAERTKVNYPPETEMIRFVFSGENAAKESRDFANGLAMSSRVAPSSEATEQSGVAERIEVRIEGDTAIQNTQISRSPSLFGGGKTWYVFLRGKNVRQILKRLPEFHGIVDVDPIECV